MSCGVGLRCSLDLALLLLWSRLAATARIGPLAWELPYATGAAQKRHTHTHTHKILEKEFQEVPKKQNFGICCVPAAISIACTFY